MASDKHAGDGRESSARPPDESFFSEGLDDELLRQLARLLELDHADGPRSQRNRTDEPLRRQARMHLDVARLSFEAGLSDRAETAVHAALSLTPDDDAALRLLAAIHHRRGELGAAIVIHAEIASRTSGEPSALAELGRIFEASMRDESTRTRPPSLMGEPSLPAGMADLEQAFRQAFSGNLKEALRLVDRVAARARTDSRSLYKLAMLERAFLLEQAQDVRGAIATLERLADEPGLASDVERLLCLSMLYEREGTAERIRRALRAVRHAYLVTRRPTLLRRIARLTGKLGHSRLAEHFEARYLEVFRRRMHALSLRDAARALSLAYVPPEGMAALPFSRRAVLSLAERHHGRRRPEHRRRAAVLALWAGELGRAAALFEDLDRHGRATAIDLLYLADALEAEGRPDEADEVRRRAVARLEKLDAAALVRLLSGERATSEDARIALSTEERLAEASKVLRARHKASPEDERVLLSLGRIAEARGALEEAGQHEAHARALSEARRAPRPFVLAAAAFRRAGEVRGLVHELWVETRRVGKGRGGLDAGDVLGSVAAELQARSVAIFHALRVFLRARYPHRVARDINDRRFFLRITKDDEPSSGDSAGLPIALALASAMMGLSIPPDMAFSGAIVCDAHDVISIGRIGDVDAKIEGAYERRLSRIVLPHGNRDDVAHAERVPRRIAEHMVVFARTLDEVLEVVFPELAS